MASLLSKIASAAIAIMLVGSRVGAQPAGETSEPKGTFLLTIFFKHDQSKPLEQINAELRR
jgi:hypothetical protein